METELSNLALTTGLGLAGVAGLFSYGAFHPRSRLFAPVVYRGKTTDPPSVALTFDDGPDDRATPAILDELAARDVKATFFVIGRHVERCPDLIRRIDAEGHLIGNHSYDHSHYGMFRWRRYWCDQLLRTEQAIEQIIGRRTAFFRPPMGFKQHHIARAARDGRYALITWSRRAMDGRKTSERRIIERLTMNVRPGDILVMHDGVDPWMRRSPRMAVKAIGPLLETLGERGLGCCRLDELIETPGYRMPEAK